MGEGTPPRRNANRGRVLQALRWRGACTRGELGRMTGLSRSAVAQIVAGLIDEGTVVETGTDGKSRGSGRPPALVSLRLPDGHIMGVDFGHGHVRVAVADLECTILAERESALDVDHRGGEALERAAHLIDDALADAGVRIDDVREVVAGVPGPIDRRSLTVRSPTILSSWVDIAPAEELARRVGRPVHIENDADLGAHGELRFGAGRGRRDIVYVRASHGIGAGLVLNGQQYRGTRGFAGEIGHTLIDRDGVQICRCGNRGCLETIASATEVERQLQQILRPRPGEALPPLHTLSDPVARRVFVAAGRAIGRVLADVCNCLNPEAVIIGGELSDAGEPVIAGVRESIDRYAQPATAEAVSVVTAGLGLRSELVGALALAASRTLTRATVGDEPWPAYGFPHPAAGSAAPELAG